MSIEIILLLCVLEFSLMGILLKGEGSQVHQKVKRESTANRLDKEDTTEDQEDFEGSGYIRHYYGEYSSKEYYSQVEYTHRHERPTDNRPHKRNLSSFAFITRSEFN